MVSLTSKKISLKSIVLEIVRILDGNPEKGSRRRKLTRNWSAKVEAIDSNHIVAEHPEGYGLIFELKTENGSGLKIEIKAKITFHDKNIWERLTASEREKLHPSLKMTVGANHSPQEIAKGIVGKIMANYVKYFEVGKQKILEEEQKVLRMRSHILECSEIIGGTTKGRGFSGHTEKGYFIIGVPSEREGCMTIKIEDVEPEKVKEILKMLMSGN